MASSDSCAWYEAPKGTAHDEVTKFVNYVRSQQDEMRENWRTYLDLYSRGNPTGLGRSTSSSNYWYGRELENGVPQVSFNIAAAGVDTAFSLIGQAPSIPQYMTTDGDFKLIRQAEKASQTLQGQFNDEVKEVCKRAELDALKLGTGFVFQRFDPITGIAGVERESAFNVYVEHLDGMYGRPRVMARTRLMPRRSLAAQMPKYAEDIMTAPGILRNTSTDLFMSGLGNGFSHSDFVEVVEAWYLRPTAKKKGRHVMVVGNVTLLDTAYNHDDFPCSVFRYREAEVGFYGLGLIESAEPHQNRVDALIRKIARAQNLASNIVIFNPNGEDTVSHSQITNDLGLIINYSPLSGLPTLAKWEGTLDDLQNQVELEFQRFMITEGISESQANGMGAGRGLDSGVAVRAADDVQSRRLVPYVSRFQASMMHTARLFERMNDDLAAANDNYVVQVEGGGDGFSRSRFLKTSQWSKIRPPRGDARLTMAQMSALPTTPQGRWAAVNEWIQAGFCNRQYAMQLLQFPDLDAFASTELAHLDLARWQIEQIIDGAEPMPDPRQDLEMALDLATKSKLKVYTMGADEDTLTRFEDFCVFCEYLLEQANPPAPAPTQGAGTAPGMLPPGAPAPGMPLPTQVVAPGLGQAVA
jgi:hypothetical protein